MIVCTIYPTYDIVIVLIKKKNCLSVLTYKRKANASEEKTIACENHNRTVFTEKAMHFVVELFDKFSFKSRSRVSSAISFIFWLFKLLSIRKASDGRNLYY